MHFSPKLLATLVVAGVLLPAAAGAQAPAAGSGLQMQQLGKGIPVDLPLDFSRSPGQRTGPSAVVYIDGRRRSAAALEGFNPDDIADVSVLNSRTAHQLGPEEAKGGVLLVTTKAGEHTHAVRAFNRCLRKLEQPCAPASSPR